MKPLFLMASHELARSGYLACTLGGVSRTGLMEIVMIETNTATAIPPRPKYWDDAVRELAVDGIIGLVAEWIETNSQFEQKALKEALLRCLDTNAYTYASNLEQRYGWAPDAGLVCVLDQLTLVRAHEEVVKAWVTYHGVKVPFKEGDRVCAPTIKSGTIQRVLSSTARIGIKSDEDAENSNTMVRVIDFEDATPILGTIGTAPAAEGGAS
ncbi:hypothetical protein RU07_20780 [Agrobacterium tumefaciens]|uniref:Uncharacterized protein n=1 Tax=Agrobacterium tumefaciens TaxID=358 RepID=A0A0D0KM41_AGRTU|nr:hypothetical protein RU07_20780 [Agrobacterium tumefaciens]